MGHTPESRLNPCWDSERRPTKLASSICQWHNKGLLLAIGGYWWLLVAIGGYWWLLLAIVF